MFFSFFLCFRLSSGGLPTIAQLFLGRTCDGLIIDTLRITTNHYESRDWSQWYPVISSDSFDSEQFSERFKALSLLPSSNCVQPLFSAMCMWICRSVSVCNLPQVRRSCGQRSLQTETAHLDLGKFARRHPQCSNAGSTTLHITALPLDHVVNHVVSWKMVMLKKSEKVHSGHQWIHSYG